MVGATWPDRFGAARLSARRWRYRPPAYLVIGLVPTPIGLMIGTVIFASGVAFTMPALLTLAVSRVPPEERGSVVGTTTVFADVVFGFARWSSARWPMWRAMARHSSYRPCLRQPPARCSSPRATGSRGPSPSKRVGSRRWASMKIFVGGAGLMGHGIAQVFAATGRRVVLYEPELARAAAADRIAGNLEPGQSKGRLEGGRPG